MKKNFIIFIFVFVFIWFTIVLIAPNYIGAKVASGFKNYLQSDDIISLRQYGISLTLTDYQRGYFSSHAAVELNIINPRNHRLLLSNTLNYEFSHAPLSLSGFHWVRARMVNGPSFTGQIAHSLPNQLINVQANVNLLGNITQHIQLYPFAIETTVLPVKRLNVSGAQITWHSHLQDFPTKGHGELHSTLIQWQNQFDQLTRIEGLNATLAISNEQKILTMDNLSLDYQTSDQQIIQTNIDKIVQTQDLAPQGEHVIPLSYSIVLQGLTVSLNDQPQLTINEFNGDVGLHAAEQSYDLNLRWTGDITVAPAYDDTQFPWLAVLPTEQEVSIKLSPIATNQLPAWSALIETIIKSSAPSNQYLAELGQLLRFNIINERMQISLLANLSKNTLNLAKLNIFIDERIDDAQQLNTLINHGINPHWFYDSHAQFSLNRTWLKDIKLLPLALVFMGEWLVPDEQGNLNMRANISNQQLMINDKVTY